MHDACSFWIPTMMHEVIGQHHLFGLAQREETALPSKCVLS